MTVPKSDFGCWHWNTFRGIWDLEKRSIKRQASRIGHPFREELWLNRSGSLSAGGGEQILECVHEMSIPDLEAQDEHTM